MYDSSIDSIRRIRQLPPPSRIAQEIIRIVVNEDVNLQDLVDIINKSPAITARILRCANSAYFGQRGQINSVREAIIRVLGLKLTSSLSLAMALTSTFDTKKCPSFDPERYWFNAVTTAIIAQELSGYLNTRNKPIPSTAYTAGLLHYIGLQALVHIFPNEMAHAFIGQKDTLKQRIQEKLGIDHHQAAVIMSQSWDLPQEITGSLASADITSFFDDNDPLIPLIWLSAQISDQLYLDNSVELQQLKFVEQTISSEHIQKVITEMMQQLEGLQEIAQLITRAEG